MAVSEETKTAISRSLVRDIDDLYPDREATKQADGTYDKRDTGSTYRINKDEVPTTTQDMSALFQWEHGDKVYGTNAKMSVGMKNYIKDINTAWGQENSYLDIYIDTLREKVLVSEQLQEFKK
jgi:hypothetical protein